MSTGNCKDELKYTEREVSYMRTIVDAAALTHTDKTLADALKVVGWILRGWTLDAARHQVSTVEPRLLANGGKLR